MHGSRKLAWLGLTPEPERELPHLVAQLRSRAPGAAAADAEATELEQRRVERLVLHGSLRSWLRYLGEVARLVADVASGAVPADPAIALDVGEVVLSHHQLLIGLPGDAYEQAAVDRALLSSAVHRLRGRAGGVPVAPPPIQPEQTREEGSR